MSWLSDTCIHSPSRDRRVSSFPFFFRAESECGWFMSSTFCSSSSWDNSSSSSLSSSSPEVSKVLDLNVILTDRLDKICSKYHHRSCWLRRFSPLDPYICSHLQSPQGCTFLLSSNTYSCTLTGPVRQILIPCCPYLPRHLIPWHVWETSKLTKDPVPYLSTTLSLPVHHSFSGPTSYYFHSSFGESFHTSPIYSTRFVYYESRKWEVKKRPM